MIIFHIRQEFLRVAANVTAPDARKCVKWDFNVFFNIEIDFTMWNVLVPLLKCQLLWHTQCFLCNICRLPFYSPENPNPRSWIHILKSTNPKRENDKYLTISIWISNVAAHIDIRHPMKMIVETISHAPWNERMILERENNFIILIDWFFYSWVFDLLNCFTSPCLRINSKMNLRIPSRDLFLLAILLIERRSSFRTLTIAIVNINEPNTRHIKHPIYWHG